MVLLTKATARGTIPIVPPRPSVMGDTVQTNSITRENRVTHARGLGSSLPKIDQLGSLCLGGFHRGHSLRRDPEGWPVASVTRAERLRAKAASAPGPTGIEGAIAAPGRVWDRWRSRALLWQPFFFWTRRERLARLTASRSSCAILRACSKRRNWSRLISLVLCLRSRSNQYLTASISSFRSSSMSSGRAVSHL
jgi:hypothetical protein